MSSNPEAPTRGTLGASRQWGRIQVLPSAVAAIAAHAATGSYGVTAMAARGLRDGMAELLRRESAHRGVDVREVDGNLTIDLYVVVKYGLRITEVAHNVQSVVKFEIERAVGGRVTDVNVFVQGVSEDRER